MSNSPTENPLRESEVELKGKSKEEVSNDTPKKVVKVQANALRIKWDTI